MFGHLPELLIVLVLGLVFFGPEKLPEIAAQTGKMIRELRLAMNAAMDEPHASAEPDDAFATYYYDSQARSGEAEGEVSHPIPVHGQGVDYANTGNEELDDHWKSIFGAEAPDQEHPAAVPYSPIETETEESERRHDV